MNPNNFTSKNNIYFDCQNCNFKCCKKGDWNRHIMTNKHKTLTNPNNNTSTDNLINVAKTYDCKCGKKYKHLSTLSLHKKMCNVKLQENNTKNNNNNENINNFLIDYLKQNQEFQKQIFDFMKNNVGVNNYNTNCNNKAFNLNFFLNEQCKDALNVSDFVNSLKLTLEDLENVGENGFVNGISRIFINGLKKLDVYKRPIHCSDLKRETIHLKNENVWEKDNENKEQMKKVIKQIANKNINKIYEWKDKYPDCKYSDSKKNDQYSRIIIESMGARTIEEDQALYEKIIKNIAKETTIDKSK